MIINLEPDILECEVKRALGSITSNKNSGGDRIPVELFQISKDDAVKVLHSIASKFGKLSSGQRTGKDQFSFQSQRRAMPKNAQTAAQLHSSYMLVKWCSKFPQHTSTVCEPWNSWCSSWFSKRQRDERSNCQHLWIYKKAREFQKNIYFCFIDYPKGFDSEDHNKLWKKILKEIRSGSNS